MKKICVLFPGIGYHCDKPLLYYAAKLAKSKGYEVIKLKFSGFPQGAKGNEDKLSAAAAHGLELSRQQLSDINFNEFDRIVFIGKSIGTRICLEYREEQHIAADCILLTPLVQTFMLPSHCCTAFHGTADPWAQTEQIRRLCQNSNVKLYEYDGADHSLETGVADNDIRITGSVMKVLNDIIR